MNELVDKMKNISNPYNFPIIRLIEITYPCIDNVRDAQRIIYYIENQMGNDISKWSIQQLGDWYISVKRYIDTEIIKFDDDTEISKKANVLSDEIASIIGKLLDNE
jgi:hypothetical protein